MSGRWSEEGGDTQLRRSEKGRNERGKERQKEGSTPTFMPACRLSFYPSLIFIYLSTSFRPLPSTFRLPTSLFLVYFPSYSFVLIPSFPSYSFLPYFTFRKLPFAVISLPSLTFLLSISLFRPSVLPACLRACLPHVRPPITTLQIDTSFFRKR